MGRHWRALKVNDKVLGAIYIKSYTEGIHYTDQDDSVLEYVAQHVANALTRCARWKWSVSARPNYPSLKSSLRRCPNQLIWII